MQLNTIKPAPGSKPARVRVGRGIGSGLGKTCGRGHKGQFARAGKGKIKAGFEGGQMPLQRRLPKVGFRSLQAGESAELALFRLSAFAGQSLDLEAMKAAGLIPAYAQKAKIILRGEVSGAVHLKGIKATARAKEAIIAAGGSVE